MVSMNANRSAVGSRVRRAISVASSRSHSASSRLTELARDNLSALANDMNRLSSIALLARGTDTLGGAERATKLYKHLQWSRSAGAHLSTACYP